jgi:hypothetical protein
MVAWREETHSRAGISAAPAALDIGTWLHTGITAVTLAARSVDMVSDMFAGVGPLFKYEF